MSRAFVREQDDAGLEAPPELKISHHPNFVTPRGFALIEARLAEIEQALAAEPSEADRQRLQRDQRYWSARRATAHVVEPHDDPDGEIIFGSRVTLQRSGGDPETIEIVGEDEADPTHGRLSWVSPFAAALLGAVAGEIVAVGPRDPPVEVKILAVEKISDD